MLYSFFWVIPLRLNFRSRRFGTLCSIFIVRVNPLNAMLNPICHLLALSGAHPIFHVSRIRVNKKYNYDEVHRVFVQGRRKEKGPGGGVRAEEQAEGCNDPKWRSVGRQVCKGTRKRNHGMVVILFTRPTKMEQKVPKPQYIKFRRQRITQKTEHNILKQNSTEIYWAI